MKKSIKNIITTLILIVAGICFCVSAFSLGRYAWQTWQAQKSLNELAQAINTEKLVIAENGESDLSDAEKMMARYGDLYRQNNDFMGWLAIEGTKINCPVMYTPDDPQHYLRKDFNGDYAIGGMLFIDYRCSMDPASTDIIIYGHHMNNGTMFGPLLDYKDTDFLEAHRQITFDTLYRPGTYEVFATFISPTYEAGSDAFKYYDFIEASTENELTSYLDNIKALSLYYDEDNAPVFGDEIITLSTCDYTIDDGRFAVLAKRISE